MAADIFNAHIECIQNSFSEAGKIENVVNLIRDCVESGNKILVCGNGGSAADAQHFAAELVGRFQKERDPVPCIALTTDTSILTAVGNDYGFDDIFSRQVKALAKDGDLLIAISTSGSSPNIEKALLEMMSKGTTVLLTGDKRGKSELISDIVIRAKSQVTARIQEFHELVLHTICELYERN